MALAPQRNGLVCNDFRDSVAVSPPARATNLPSLMRALGVAAFPEARSRRSVLDGQVMVTTVESTGSADRRGVSAAGQLGSTWVQAGSAVR